MTKCDQSGNYGAGARAKHQIELRVQRPSKHRLNFFKDTQSVEAFGPSAIQGQHTKPRQRTGFILSLCHLRALFLSVRDDADLAIVLASNFAGNGQRKGLESLRWLGPGYQFRHQELE
ncbi:hypothetical protein IAE39_004016 [Pseudomonas sp. S37]|nr:hypothetical protein [Pseudomonas sp. S37]